MRGYIAIYNLTPSVSIIQAFIIIKVLNTSMYGLSCLKNGLKFYGVLAQRVDYMVEIWRLLSVQEKGRSSAVKYV